VVAGQRRIVPLYLGAGVAGVGQEIEVVHRDNLRRVPGRDEQGVRGVDDVGGARQRLDRRPRAPVPQIVQPSYRHAPIHHARVQRRARAIGDAILPRAGEHGHVVVVARGVGVHQSMDVRTGTGTRAQRGTIVHQDTHAARHLEGTSPYSVRFFDSFKMSRPAKRGQKMLIPSVPSP
jgi:hypothetical protein